jgi:threonine/homoserine/homoserine lactone efflux protein
MLSLGFAIGMATSAPVGPVNIMALHRALRSGFLAGLTTALGALLADTMFAAAALFGLAAIVGFIEGHAGLIRLVGGVVLVVFGVLIMRKHPHFNAGPVARGGLLAGAATAFAMTITNPGAVLGILALIGGLGDRGPEPGDFRGALAILLGVMLGGATWWLAICGLAHRFRARITDKWLDWINEVAGLMLVLFGLAVLADLAMRTLR